MNVIELFAGAGGAALGLRAAGLKHLAMIDRDPVCCATLRANGFNSAIEACVGDLPKLFRPEWRGVDLVWASFPCQPFSTAGSKRSVGDDRNCWPMTARAIDIIEPRWFLAENVQGLTFHRRGCGFRQGGLFQAGSAQCPGCYLASTIMRDLRDRFAFTGCEVLNCADYGTPQTRKRLVMWGGPSRLAMPTPSHGKGTGQPWVSMSTAIGVTATVDGGRNSTANPRQERPIDGSEPCFTIGTRGNQVVRSPDGSKRRLEPEECKILQGFPASYRITGNSKISRFRQVGNAVPPQLAEALGRSVMAAKWMTDQTRNEPKRSEL